MTSPRDPGRCTEHPQRPAVKAKRCATCDRSWQKAATERRKDADALRIYGVPSGAYAALLVAQEGRCAICRIARGDGRRRLQIDHDHAKGFVPEAVRGLLCKSCNWLVDNPGVAERIAAYLSNPPAVPVVAELLQLEARRLAR